MLPSMFGENLFDDFFDDFDKEFFGSRNPLYGKRAKNLMKTDVKETRDCYKVAIDLPGFKKDEVKVELRGRLSHRQRRQGPGQGRGGQGGPLPPPGALRRRLQPQLLCGRYPPRGHQRQVRVRRAAPAHPQGPIPPCRRTPAASPSSKSIKEARYSRCRTGLFFMENIVARRPDTRSRVAHAPGNDKLIFSSASAPERFSFGSGNPPLGRIFQDSSNMPL